MKISNFAREHGISARTLRYYDEIGLLRPARVDAETGYREYDDAAAERLRAIRFYQTVGFSLEEVQTLLDAPDDTRLAALERQRARVIHQRDRLDRLIGLLAPQGENKPKQASLTSLLSAFARAYHAASDAPLFHDDVTRQLMTDGEYGQISRYILDGRAFLMPDLPDLPDAEALQRLVNTQFAPVTVARTCFSEACLQTAIRTGTQQAVILGAGMDTLALRGIEVPVYEVDHPVTQADKLARIRRCALESAATYVPMDFTLDDLPSHLREAGFDPARKTLFTWLGVSYYLPLDVVDDMLSDLAALSTRGTAIVFDYADEGLFTSEVRRVKNMIAMAQAAGEPLKTAFSEAQLTALLERHGFQVYELLTWRQLQERYFAGRTDGLSAFEHIGCVLAVYTGA